MNRFHDDEAIQEIEARINIVDVVGETIKLTRKGNRYWGLCPFHQEKTPSFTVNPDKNMFYCFGCHSGGNIFSYVMKKEGLDFKEALEKLAALAGVELPSRRTGPDQKRRQDLIQINKEAGLFFQQTLYSPEGRMALEYLLNRGLTVEACQTFQLGFAKDGWQTLLEAMTRKGYSAEVLKELGLIKRSEDKNRYFDLFRKRVIFPIKAVNGDILGFGGRILDEGQPKYLNTQETKIYSKRNQLYGLYQSRESIRKSNQVYLVEGYLDCIKMYQAGITNVAASLGTAFTPGQAELLHRYAEEAVIVYDGDEAGQRETLKAIEVLLTEGMKVSVITLPDGMDPDNFVDFYEKKEFLHYIQNNKISHIQFRLHYLLKKENVLNLTVKMKILAELKPDLQQIQSPIEAEYYIRLLANQLQLEENLIERELKMGSQRKKKAVSGNKTEIIRDNNEYGNYSLEEKILAIMLTEEEVFQKIDQAIGIQFFQDPHCQAIMDTFIQLEDRFLIPWSRLATVLSERDLASRLAKISWYIAEDRELNDRQIDDFINHIKIKRKNAHWQNIFQQLNALKYEGDFQDLLNFIINLDIFLTQEGGRK